VGILGARGAPFLGFDENGQLIVFRSEASRFDSF
jgi:hypothetical protein